MSEIAANPINNYPGAPPIQNFHQKAAPQRSVSITAPQQSVIYQYPQTSVYDSSGKNAASGLNIYVFNPAGAGAPSTINNYTNQNGAAANGASGQNAAIAAAPFAKETEKTEKSNGKKPKNIVKLTNDYIKTLESFLRSPDKTIRKQGIMDLVKRFEEDESRYDNPALTALLNLSLQDPDVHNRMAAMSVISAGEAHGDDATIQLLRILSNSDKMYGQEAMLASNALLKTSYTKEKAN